MKSDDYVIGLEYAKTVIDKEIARFSEIRDWYIHDDAMFDQALALLSEAGIPAHKEHTGGGIYVIYVRKPFEQPKLERVVYEDTELETIEWPSIGITPSEDPKARDSYLVMGYRQYDDDSMDWIETVPADQLVATVETMIEDMKRHIGAEHDQLSTGIPHREWVHGLCVDARLSSVKDYQQAGIWNARVTHTTTLIYERYEGGDNQPERHLHPRIIEFWKQAGGNPPAHNFEWAVYWADEIGLNDWIMWFIDKAQAISYFSRLIEAVFLDLDIDQIPERKAV